MQTDKAELEVPAPAAGVVKKILVPADEFADVGQVVALIGGTDEEVGDLSQYGEGGEEEEAAAGAPAEPEPATQASAAATPAPAAPESVPAGETFASPRARKKAEELGVDVGQIAGSGVNARVMEGDVIAQAETAKGPKATPTARRLAEARGVDLAGVEGTGAAGKVTKEDVERAEERPAAQAAPAAAPAELPPATGEVREVQLTPMRRIIAERMAQSKYNAPHYYVTIEADMTNAKAYRGANPAFRPSFNDLVVRAVSRACQKYPAVNARWAGDKIEELGDINIGVAVALPDGLIVPVIKKTQLMSVQEIHDESKRLIDKARTGKIAPDEYRGNTITVSNLGAFGIDHFTAIINQPDSAIIAVGQIKDTVVVIDGGIQIRPIMKLTMSSDHRVIDGAVAAQFMGHLKKVIEKADFKTGEHHA
jgi:pyruvate dehydrogenase E2 component (dihydrolipoamide acetyltransferase)